MKKSYTDQIKDLEATRVETLAELDAIQSKAADEGRSKDAEEKEKFDTLKLKVRDIDAELVDLRDMEAINKASAKAIVAPDIKSGAEARNPQQQVITVKDTMPGDIAFGAMVLCKAHAFLEMMRGNFITPLDVAKQRYPHNKAIHDYLLAKTAVIGGTTTDTNYAASLFPPAQILESAFLEYLRPLTIVDRFGTTQNGVAIPSLRRVPFNVKIQSQTTGAAASWVGEGKGKPVTKFNTTDTTLLFNKIAAIAVITDELARFSRPGAEGLVRDELARAVVERMDTDFVDPAKAVSSGVNPASMTNGLTALTSAGTSAANVLSDVQALVAPFLRLNYSVRGLVLLMPDTLALTLSLMQNSLGQDSFTGMTVNGGTLAGLPVLTSNYLASGASFGNMVVCLSADNIALADDGNVTVDASREASIQMEDVSTMDATAGTGQTSVSMFQTNSIAIRAEREITWKKLRSTAVVYMDDVNWGSIGSPV